MGIPLMVANANRRECYLGTVIVVTSSIILVLKL